LLKWCIWSGRILHGKKGQEAERLFGEVEAGGLDIETDKGSVEAPEVSLSRFPGSLRPGVKVGDRLPCRALSWREKQRPKGRIGGDEGILGSEEAKGKRAHFKKGPTGGIREIRDDTLRRGGRNVRRGRAHGPDGSLE
jgi:hypothetical protein